MAEQTSKISVTQIAVPKGASRVRSTTARVDTATKLTGPTPTDNGELEYKTEIIRYDNAKGDNAVTIGERNNKTGRIDWNSNASTNEIKNGTKLGQSSITQINDVQRDFVGPLSAAEKKAFNKAAGNPNKAIGSGTEDRRPIGGTGGRRTRYSSGVNQNQSSNQQPTARGAANDFFAKKSATPRRNFRPPGGGAIVYPVALRQNQQDFLKFEMLEYVAKGFSTNQRSGGVALSGVGNKRNAARSPLGTVVLPIPGGISDANAAQWGEENMNPLDAALAGAALNIINRPVEGTKDALKSARSALEGSTGELKRAVSTAFAGAASGLGEQVLTRSTGEILNPNMELLFKGPGLRTFGFTYKLAPRSAKEAQSVIAILKFFKQGMAPIKSPSNLFLKSPNTFRLGYYHKGRNHSYLNKFKECALQNVTVEYTPDGNYATYDDGIMTAYNMTLSFQELEPIFSQDYDSGYDEIGY